MPILSSSVYLFVLGERVTLISATWGPSPSPHLRLSLQLEQIRKDIQDFRSQEGLDKVIVLWTANTERFCDVVPGLNDTAENLLHTIQVAAGWGEAERGGAAAPPSHTH